MVPQWKPRRRVGAGTKRPIPSNFSTTLPFTRVRIRLNPEFELQFKLRQAKFKANYGPAILAGSHQVSTSFPPPLAAWIETQGTGIVYDLHCSQSSADPVRIVAVPVPGGVLGARPWVHGDRLIQKAVAMAESPISPSTSGKGAIGPGLKGRRVLVVGASAGIGRAFAVRALDVGAHVVVTSRRADRLDALLADADTDLGLVAVGDVRKEEDCRRIVDEAASALGEIDLILYSAGVAPLEPLASTTAADWASVLETHVLGLHHVVQAALEHLSSAAVVAVLSSETVGRPRSMMGAYGASKAALEESVRTWSIEQPLVRFSTIAVGGCFPTEFGDSFDPGHLTDALNDWTRHGLMTERMLDPDDVAGTLAGILGTALDYPDVGLEHMVIRANSPVLGASPTPP
jgi:NAD(P)-dependent dehydrogenase (short-subunit alcohol dehydrogenase family)